MKTHNGMCKNKEKEMFEFSLNTAIVSKYVEILEKDLIFKKIFSGK